jgi:DNA-binding GntR family transcriptional regulator
MPSFSDLRVTAAPSLREMVAARLRDAIASGQFAPGARLVERELCLMTGVSRTSLREALRELVTEGLLINSPNKGLTVAVIGPREAKEIYEVRSLLEGLAARNFVDNATPEQVAALGNIVEQLRAQHDADEPEPFLTIKDEFSNVLLIGGGNDTVGVMLRQIYTRLRRLRCASSSSKSRRQELIAQIGDLYQALSSRDSDLAWDISLANVRRACEVALSRMVEQPDSPGAVTIISDEEPLQSTARVPEESLTAR